MCTHSICIFVVLNHRLDTHLPHSQVIQLNIIVPIPGATDSAGRCVWVFDSTNYAHALSGRYSEEVLLRATWWVLERCCALDERVQSKGIAVMADLSKLKCVGGFHERLVLVRTRRMTVI